MRHKKKGRKLSRNSSHRKLMLQNMVNSLVHHEVIKTTIFKAKELRCVIEPLITISKKDSVSNRRLIFARTQNIATVEKLFKELGVRFKLRAGGYTRILKCGYRSVYSDNAQMAYIQLIKT